MDSSPGYPYVLDRTPGTVGREYLFDVYGQGDQGQNRYSANTRLMAGIETILSTAKTERYCANNVYVDQPKVERRPLAKIWSASTRFFNIASIDWLLVNKMYFGAFASAYMRAGFSVGCGLAMNIHGSDPTSLISIHKEVGENYFDGDVKAWDGTLDCLSKKGSIRVMTEWLKYFDPNADCEILHTIGGSLMWRIHIFGETVYMVNDGMPSGSFLTAIVNTLSWRIRIKMLWILLARVWAPELANCRAFHEHVRATSVGDDLFGSCSDQVTTWWHPEHLAAEAAKYGITLVPPQKREGKVFEKGFLPLSEIQFVKCNFRPDHRYSHKFHACMQLDDPIGELLNWIRTGLPEREMLYSNIGDALEFAYQHGSKTFHQIRDLVNEALKQSGLPPIRTSFEELDRKWLTENNLITYGDIKIGD